MRSPGYQEGAALSYTGDDTDRAVFDEAAGAFSLTGLATNTDDGTSTVIGLEDYSLKISDLQEDFNFDVSVTTEDDGAAASNAVTGTIFIDTRPLYSPTFLDRATGEQATTTTLSVSEDGVGGTVRDRCPARRPAEPQGGPNADGEGTVVYLELMRDSEIELTASVLGSEETLQEDPSLSTAGVAVFALTAAGVARGIEFSVDDDEDSPGADLSGAFGQPITLRASTNYGVGDDGEEIIRDTETGNELGVSLVVNPVVDGVSFLSPDPIDEDSGRVALTDLFELSDASESVESLLVGRLKTSASELVMSCSRWLTDHS